MKDRRKWKWVQEAQKKSENNRKSEHECENEHDEIEEQCAGVTCVFVNSRITFIDEHVEVQEENQEEVNRTILDEEVMQAIVSKEAIAAADTSVKESNMVGCWKIENNYENVSV